MKILRRKKRRDRVWFEAKPESEIRLLPFWIAVGKVARFFYRLRRWDWSDWTPEPMPPLSQTVAEFGRPVYGILDDFMHLEPGGRCYSTDEIELHYSELTDEGEKRIGIKIASLRISDEPEPDLVVEMRTRAAAYSAAFSFSDLEFRLREMNKDVTSPTDFLSDYPMTKVQDLSLHVAGFTEPAEVWRWDVPEPVYVLLLQTDEVILRMATFDLSSEQLIELTHHVGRIDDRLELIEEYDRRARRRWEEYERRLAEEHGE